MEFVAWLRKKRGLHIEITSCHKAIQAFVMTSQKCELKVVIMKNAHVTPMCFMIINLTLKHYCRMIKTKTHKY